MDDCSGSHLGSRQGWFCLPHQKISHASCPITINSYLSVQLVLNGGGRHAAQRGKGQGTETLPLPGLRGAVAWFRVQECIWQ